MFKKGVSIAVPAPWASTMVLAAPSGLSKRMSGFTWILSPHLLPADLEAVLASRQPPSLLLSPAKARFEVARFAQLPGVNRLELLLARAERNREDHLEKGNCGGYSSCPCAWRRHWLCL